MKTKITDYLFYCLQLFGPTLTEKVDAFDDYLKPASTFTTDLQLEVDRHAFDSTDNSASNTSTFAQNPSIPTIIPVDESPTFSDEVQSASVTVEATQEQQSNARAFEPEITLPFDFATSARLGTSQAKPKTIVKGATVRFKCVGSTRHGLTATVRYVKADGECNIQFHEQTLPAHLISHSCLVSMLEVISDANPVNGYDVNI